MAAMRKLADGRAKIKLWTHTVHTNARIHPHTHTHIHTHARACVRIHSLVLTYVPVHTRTHIHSHIHPLTHLPLLGLGVVVCLFENLDDDVVSGFCGGEVRSAEKPFAQLAPDVEVAL